jgi:uncharacterized membrane protein YbhN (UPF0104 family)
MTTEPNLTEAEEAALDPGAVPAPGQPSRRGVLVRTGLIVGILFVVFVLILPQYVSYQDVIDAFASLTIQQIAVMTAMGFVGWFLSGLVFTALIPGLGPRRGLQSYLILAGMGASIPAGPWNMGVVWVVQRGWGISNAAASAGIGLYGIVDILGRLFLPLLAILVLVATGQMPDQQDSRAVWSIAVISIVAFFVVGGAILAVVGSERLATAVANRLQGFTEAVIRRLGRPLTADVTTAVLNFRNHLGEVIRRRGLSAIVVSVLSKIWWAAVLTVALRFCGVPDQALTVAEIFEVFALVFVITIVPIAPGGAGVPELLFISGFTAIAGDAYTDQITAGVFLYRAYQWFLPIPLAWILLKAARRGRSMLPSTAELRASAAGAEPG